MPTILTSIVKKIFRSFGLEITTKRKTNSKVDHQPHMLRGLHASKVLLDDVRTVIDVGAAAGTWSLSAKQVWPNASFLLFEPLAERKELLEDLVRKHPNFYYVNAAAGNEPGRLSFRIANDLDGSGVARAGETDLNLRSVDLTRIDAEVQKRNLKGPYVIKLDTHGFEVPIIEGCSRIIHETVLFIIECYGFQIADNSLLLWEMCRHMDQQGFRLFNIVDVMNRKKDGAFWQCDAFFIRKDHPMFNDNKYQ